jgi:hypothetical protein
VRTAILVVALVFTAAIGAATLDVLFSEGFDAIVALSLLVVALFAFGILGALTHKPDE